MITLFKSGMILLAGSAVFLALGCSNTPLRTEGSTSGIRAAEEAGADKVPQASLHLQLAKENLELAKAQSGKGEKEQAASTLLKAEADAELAVALSHGDAERNEARAAIARVQQLRQENP